jgi:hypothetical protein
LEEIRSFVLGQGLAGIRQWRQPERRIPEAGGRWFPKWCELLARRRFPESRERI